MTLVSVISRWRISVMGDGFMSAGYLQNTGSPSSKLYTVHTIPECQVLTQALHTNKSFPQHRALIGISHFMPKDSHKTARFRRFPDANSTDWLELSMKRHAAMAVARSVHAAGVEHPNNIGHIVHVMLPIWRMRIVQGQSSMVRRMKLVQNIGDVRVQFLCVARADVQAHGQLLVKRFSQDLDHWMCHWTGQSQLTHCDKTSSQIGIEAIFTGFHGTSRR